jgi:hypothetical protein
MIEKSRILQVNRHSASAAPSSTSLFQNIFQLVLDTPLWSSSWRIFEMKNYNSKREELEEEDQREDERNVIL